MSFWTMFWIALIITGLYFALLIIVNVLEFISSVIRFFKGEPASPFRVSIETTEETERHSRIKAARPDEAYPQYRIEYADVHGEISERDIYIVKADRKYLRSWCFKANDIRTFRIDRLLAAIDLSSGQPIRHIREHWGQHH